MTGTNIRMGDMNAEHYARSRWPLSNDLLAVHLTHGLLADALVNQIEGGPDATATGTVPISATGIDVGASNYLTLGVGGLLEEWSAGVLYRPVASLDHAIVSNKETAGNHGDNLWISSSGGFFPFLWMDGNEVERHAGPVSMTSHVSPLFCFVGGVISGNETTAYVGKDGLVTRATTLGSTRSALTTSNFRIGRGAGVVISHVSAVRRIAAVMIFGRGLSRVEMEHEVYPWFRDYAPTLGISGL